jgi:hypothetical protein
MVLEVGLKISIALFWLVPSTYSEKNNSVHGACENPTRALAKMLTLSRNFFI